MGKNIGTLKYILKAPLARPGNFFKFGGGTYAVLRALDAGFPADQLTLETAVPVLVTYFETKYLPPSSPKDILGPIVLGAVLAGLKWRIA